MWGANVGPSVSFYSETPSGFLPFLAPVFGFLGSVISFPFTLLGSIFGLGGAAAAGGMATLGTTAGGLAAAGAAAAVPFGAGVTVPLVAGAGLSASAIGGGSALGGLAALGGTLFGAVKSTVGVAQGAASAVSSLADAAEVIGGSASRAAYQVHDARYAVRESMQSISHSRDRIVEAVTQPVVILSQGESDDRARSDIGQMLKLGAIAAIGYFVAKEAA